MVADVSDSCVIGREIECNVYKYSGGDIKQDAFVASATGSVNQKEEGDPKKAYCEWTASKLSGSEEEADQLYNFKMNFADNPTYYNKSSNIEILNESIPEEPPIAPECTLSLVSWVDIEGNDISEVNVTDTKEDRIEGDPILLVAVGEGNCSNKEASFKIYGDDFERSFDAVEFSEENGEFVAGQEWNPVWVDEGIGQGDPEYYFKAKLLNSEQEENSPILSVSKGSGNGGGNRYPGPGGGFLQGIFDAIGKIVEGIGDLIKSIFNIFTPKID